MFGTTQAIMKMKNARKWNRKPENITFLSFSRLISDFILLSPSASKTVDVT